MDNQNITLSIPKKVLLKFKEIAFHREKSVSRLMVEMMEEAVSKEEGYRVARDSHFRQMDFGQNLGIGGQIKVNREELHER
jgi:hypothetical protein